MAVQFKLSKLGGLTRRVSFVARPTWPLLAARIARLYDVPVDNVAVSYIDSDGDDVTLSSDEELQDLYTSLRISDDATIKLAVHALSTLRAAPTASLSLPSATPQQSHFRNTFGGHEVLPLVFDTEDEWQRLPGSLGDLFLSRDAPDSPHAFVEVLESDISVSKSDATKSGSEGASRSDVTSTLTAFRNQDKGKRRAVTVEDDVSSAGSVIGDEAPTKPLVHVLEVSSESMFGLSREPTAQSPPSRVATPAQAQSTPVIPDQTLKADESIATGEQKMGIIDDDPPLPSLDSLDPDRVPPSLVNDVATLLSTITTIISTHPELSEHIRNIVSNATNGTYWAAHRDAITRAAGNLHRTALQETGRSLEEIRRTAEQEASARVAGALGSIFRTVGEFVQDGQENTSSQIPGNPSPLSPDERAPNIPRSSSPNTARNVPRFPHLPPHPRRNHHSWFTSSHFNHAEGPFWGRLAHPPPPPPPPLPPRGWPRPPPPRFWYRNVDQPESPISEQETRAAATEVLAAAAEARARATERTQITDQPPSTSEVTPEELRAEVDRAKADYKARKERYRRAKAIRKMAEQRRQAQECRAESLSRHASDNTQSTSDNNIPTIVTSPTPAHQGGETEGAETGVAAPEVHIVSNARGRYPQLEMFSVPKRSHTTGHMHYGQAHENKESRPFIRIMRKLSDMGFTESTYSNLNAKVMDQLLSHPPVNKDAEDDIVTNVIEELVSSGTGPSVGGSGGIPGAWH